MWIPLQSPRLLEFYQACQPQEDWRPMVRALEQLQSHQLANTLFAFTSLLRLHVTTAPTYADCDRHSSVSVIWDVGKKRFFLAFGSLAKGWVEDRLPEVTCNETTFAAEIEPLIRRLLDEPSHPIDR